MVSIKNLHDGMVVGIGSDYVIISKKNKKYVVEIIPSSIKELKDSVTPYGSHF